MNSSQMIIKEILLSDNIENSINNNLAPLITIIPEIAQMFNFEHKNINHHLDLWNHTLLALSLSPKNYIIRLVLLLHDIGKPFSYQETDQTTRHYKNHGEYSSLLTYNILKRLEYDDEFIEKICYLVRTHDDKITKEEINNDYELSILKYQIQYCDINAHNPARLEKRKEYLTQIETQLSRKKGIYNNLAMIAAIGQNNEIGQDNKLIWPLKEDLKFFRNQTLNKKIVMGYKTFISLPKILPQRQHLILTTRKYLKSQNQTEIYFTKNDILKEIENTQDQVYVIGGASIYRQFLPHANELVLTEIEATCREADAYFPEFNKSNWTCHLIDKHNENGINYKHKKYIRKKEWNND